MIQTKTNTKLDSNLIIPLFICIIILGGVLYLAYGNLIKPANEIADQLNEFCKNKGYNKVTDWKLDDALRPEYAEVECDNEKIFTRVSIYSECIVRDKWGDCTKQRFKVR